MKRASPSVGYLLGVCAAAPLGALALPAASDPPEQVDTEQVDTEQVDTEQVDTEQAARVSSASCRCSVDRPTGMQEMPLLSEASLQLGSEERALYFVLQALPHNTTPLFSLAGLLDRVSADARAIGPVQYTEIDGRLAAQLDVEFARKGLHLTRRWIALDTDAAMLVMQIWAPRERWEDNLALTEALSSSLRVSTEPVSPDERLWAEEPRVELEPLGLLESRAAAGLQTSAWRNPERVMLPARSGFEVVHYPSTPGDLEGYLTSDPRDGARHPAVLWVEGGFGGPSMAWESQNKRSDQSARQLQEAGIVLFVPAFRGENGNPGDMEMFYGETEDLLAALAWLRGIAWVDPERIYLAGYGTGGTNVLLAAVAGADVRASFVIGGRADLGPLMAAGGYGIEPFDRGDARAIALRSAIHWADDLAHPVFYFEGEQEYLVDAVAMGRLAREHGARMEVYPVPHADRFRALAPIKSLIAAKILADTTPQANIAFSEPELLLAVEGR